MPDICLGFEVHQPFRINKDFHEEMGRGKSFEQLFDLYFDNDWNRSILQRVANKCYIPANEIILRNIEYFKREKKQFKVAFSLSGVLIEQLERWAPDALDSFKRLAESGCVELLDQTYYHSLSSLFSAERGEFIEQIILHSRLMEEVFGFKPNVFENTEFIYNNSIAKTLESMGYKGVFTEGAERILGWRSPNYLYKADGADIALLLRNYRLSDDVAFRFSARDWPGWPLTADKYAAWLSVTPGQCINIFMDYETFGEHQWPETGVMEFLKWLPGEVLKYENLRFKTPSEIIDSHPPVDTVSVHDFSTVSWADLERDTHAWIGNNMQRTSFRALKGLEPYVKRARSETVLRLWRLLQISDHLYYMYTEAGAPGLVHGYFSLQPPVKVFWAFSRILSDFYERVAGQLDEPERTLLRLLRIFPPDKAFHFHENDAYINLSAHSLEEFLEVLEIASERSILSHFKKRDFEKWIRYVIGDDELADEISRVEGRDGAELRRELINRINRRLLSLMPREA
ncbi:MAG: alpha-amylase [Candidatus Bathyarchaeia archaeon]